ncbi:hypothetical protein ALC57_15637, partial [Trachymyrmex cornetzi]
LACCINSPLYELAFFLKNIIDKSLKKEFSHINNSFKFVKKLNLFDLENGVISKLKFDIPLYYRYVDDIILAIPKNQINETLDTFNSYHDRITFTCDRNYEGSINFLDVTVSVEEGQIKFNNYKKPTNSGRYLSFHSNHPLEHKKGVIISLLDRILFLAHPEFHNKNIEMMIITLFDNGYPLNLIFNTINKRIKCLSRRKKVYNNSSQNSDNDNSINKYFTVPYIKNISEKFKSNSIIKTDKDKLDKMEQCNVVYKINCLNCESSYVGQTKRKIKTRLKEHKSSTSNSNTVHNVVAQHQINLNHKFNWDNIEILDTEPFFQKRFTSEMI